MRNSEIAAFERCLGEMMSFRSHTCIIALMPYDVRLVEQK